MGRGGAKVKVVQKSMGVDKQAMSNIMGAFMGNPESIDKQLAKDKFKSLIMAVKRINKLMVSFDKSILNKAIVDHSFSAQWSKQVTSWCSDTSSWVEDMEATLEKDQTAMVHTYLSAKKAKPVEDCVHMCSKLSRYRKYIQSNESLDDSFLRGSKTKDLVILPFSDVDIKYIYTFCSLDESAKRYIMLFLNIVYGASHDIYQIITNPDIDISKVADIVIATIAQVKKSVPRADRAFRKIEESMEMFKNNFTEYYRDFVVSKDPSVILTNFLTDCKDTHTESDNKSDLELARQFTKIAAFFKRELNGKIKDPNVEAILNSIEETFKSLDLEESDDEE